MAGDDVGWQESLDLPDRLDLMQEKGLFSDVTFIVGDTRQPMKTHRFMMVAASPVFQAMFCGGYEEREGKTIEIPDVQYDVFKQLIK